MLVRLMGVEQKQQQKYLRSFFLGDRRDTPPRGPIQRIGWENHRCSLVGIWELKAMGWVTKGKRRVSQVTSGECGSRVQLVPGKGPWGLEDKVKKIFPQTLQSPGRRVSPDLGSRLLSLLLLSDNTFKPFHPAQSLSYISPARWLVNVWPRVTFPPPFLGPLQPRLSTLHLRCGFPQACHSPPVRLERLLRTLEVNNP